MTEFLEIAETLEKIATVSSRNAKIDFVEIINELEK